MNIANVSTHSSRRNPSAKACNQIQRKIEIKKCIQKVTQHALGILRLHVIDYFLKKKIKKGMEVITLHKLFKGFL